MVPLQHNVSSCLSQAEIRNIGYHGKESREGHQGHQGDTNGRHHLYTTRKHKQYIVEARAMDPFGFQRRLLTTVAVVKRSAEQFP